MLVGVGAQQYLKGTMMTKLAPWSCAFHINSMWFLACCSLLFSVWWCKESKGLVQKQQHGELLSCSPRSWPSLQILHRLICMPSFHIKNHSQNDLQQRKQECISKSNFPSAPVLINACLLFYFPFFSWVTLSCPRQNKRINKCNNNLTIIIIVRTLA